MSSRVRGDFDRSPTRKAKAGVSRQQSMMSTRRQKKGKRRRSRIHQLGLVALIAFIFLTPDAKKFMLSKWAEMQEYVMDGLAPFQVYPLEAEYTVLRSVDLWNNGSQVGSLEEAIPLPVDVSSNEGGGVALDYIDEPDVQKSTIQKISSVELRIDGDVISIPADGLPHKGKNDAVVTSAGNLVWWPSQGQGSDLCGHGPCVRVSVDVPPGTQSGFDLAVTLHSYTHTWWHSTRMDGRIVGKSEGVSLERSGTFADIDERGQGHRSNTFADEKWWYDRNAGSSPEDWAIDGRQSRAPNVYQVASSIEANLPANLKDNVYAYARATFDWLNTNIPYDTMAPIVARSGEQCLVYGAGDCDEQSNAFMSIMRVKNVPTWYVFGALADSQYETWQGHAWAYILIPMSDEWCNERGINLDSCYVEGSVDVVNHKWLVHTPTAYIDWVEQAPWSNVDSYYSGGTMYGSDFSRTRSFQTDGPVNYIGGTWNNKWVGEDLS